MQISMMVSRATRSQVEQQKTSSFWNRVLKRATLKIGHFQFNCFNCLNLLFVLLDFNTIPFFFQPSISIYSKDFQGFRSRGAPQPLGFVAGAGDAVAEGFVLLPHWLVLELMSQDSKGSKDEKGGFHLYQNHPSKPITLR